MVIALALAAAFADDPPLGGKDLPLTTKPELKVEFLHRQKPVQVSEYSSAASILVTRVYRYVVKGDYHSTVSHLNRDLTVKDGWHSAPTSTVETDFWRFPKSGLLKQAGLIVQQAHLVRDAKTPGGWRALPAAQSKGWLWVSYNEVFKSAKRR